MGTIGGIFVRKGHKSPANCYSRYQSCINQSIKTHDAQASLGYPIDAYAVVAAHRRLSSAKLSFMHFRLILSLLSAAYAITKCLIAETTSASNFKSYRDVSLESFRLRPEMTSSLPSIYFQSAVNRVNVSKLSHCRLRISR